MSVRYIEKTDGDFPKIAFRLKGQAGKEILIAASQNTFEQTVKQEIIAAIESNLPAWRNAVIS
jgi:N-acetylglutamate synthase-like GNAT family acetyltransferase